MQTALRLRDGLRVSLGDLLVGADVERLVGHDLLQLAVLLLELLQPLGVLCLHAAVLVAPAVQGLLGDLLGLCRFADRLPSESICSAVRSLRMICSGLCLCLFTCFGPPLPIVAGGKDSQTGRTDFRGSGQRL
jgi:hypothetical protein